MIVPKAAVAAFCAVALTGCGAISSLFAPPPQFQGAYQVGASMNEDMAAGCGAQLNDTPFEKWIKQYSTGPNQTTVIFWNAPVASSGPLNIYSGTLVNTNFHQAFNDAVTGWYDALTDSTRLPSGHYMRLYPAITDSWNTALVQTAYDDQYFDPQALATTDFGTVTGPGTVQTGSNHSTYQNQGDFLAGSIITFHRQNINRYNMYYDTNALYSMSMHEIGHALGLDHNPRVGSFMHPSNESNVPGLACNFYGALPPTADTDALIGQYDPELDADETPPPHTGGGGHIIPIATQSVTRGGLSSGEVMRGTRESIYSPKYRAQNTFVKTATPRRQNVEAYMRHLAWHHGPVDGVVDYRNLSPESLVLASNAVVQGHFVRTLSTTPIGPAPSTTYKDFQVDGVVDTAGDTVTPGQHLVIAERYAYENVPFADDPELKLGQQATVFLRRTPAAAVRGTGPAGTYEFTAPLISKWLPTSDGRVIVGRSASRVASQVNGMPLASALRAVRGGPAIGAAGANRAISGRRLGLLQSRGESPSAYLTAMQHDARDVLARAALYDRPRRF